MADLRNTVIAYMSGSTTNEPVSLELLRGATASLCSNIDELDEMLDTLLCERIINHVNGYSGGKPFNNYWLTGAKPVVATGRLPTNQHRPVLENHTVPETEKVKPNTSIQPNKTKEQTMSTALEGHRGDPRTVNQVIFDKIVESPGIDIDSLVQHALKKVADSTEKQIKKTILNLVHASKRVRVEGTRGNLKYFVASGATRPSKKTAVVKFAASKKRREKDSKQIPETVPRAPHKEHRFDLSFHLGGNLSISKGDIHIHLPPEEALILMQFANHQLAFARHSGDQS